MIETRQKVIQIGSSLGVTLSKKDLQTLGARRGDILALQVTRIEGPSKHEKLLKEYNAFLDQYGQTIQNLARK